MARPTSYNAEPDVDEWAREYAYSHGMSISRLVNEALRLFRRTHAQDTKKRNDANEETLDEEWVAERLRRS